MAISQTRKQKEKRRKELLNLTIMDGQMIKVEFGFRGKGWTRVYKDGSHDHVYTNGKVQVHKAKGKKYLAQRIVRQ